MAHSCNSFHQTTPHSLFIIAARVLIHVQAINECVFAQVHVVQSIASDGRQRSEQEYETTIEDELTCAKVLVFVEQNS